jgi:hypothetical protein
MSVEPPPALAGTGGRHFSGERRAFSCKAGGAAILNFRHSRLRTRHGRDRRCRGSDLTGIIGDSLGLFAQRRYTFTIKVLKKSGMLVWFRNVSWIDKGLIS